MNPYEAYRQRVARQIRIVVKPWLESGDSLLVAAVAEWPSMWGLRLLPGVIRLLRGQYRRYAVALTERRLIVREISSWRGVRKPGPIEIAEPRTTVSLVAFEPRIDPQVRLWRPDGRQLALSFPPLWRREARKLADMLGGKNTGHHG